MTDLIACLTSGNGSWQHVTRLIAGQEWGKIYLITTEVGKQTFKPEKKANFVLINSEEPLVDIVAKIKAQLKDKIADTEVALNLASGSGKEHMAIISAIIQSGLGFRLVAVTKDGVREV